MSDLKDTVILDGMNRPYKVSLQVGEFSNSQEWPVELAEALLASPASWTSDLYKDFYYLATHVNGYNRHEFGGAWGPKMLQDIKAGGSCEKYTTQELLDLVFHICRFDRFCDGFLEEEEPQLRLAIQEVVQRIHSDTPPTFILGQ